MSSRGFPLATPEPYANYQVTSTPKKRARDDANDDAYQHGCASWDDNRGPASRRRLSEREKSIAVSDSPPQRLATSYSGRPYLMWPDESGVLVTTYGALLPDGYKLDDSEPGRPWICPVRSCRRLFDLARNLGHHFTRFHRGCRFNDNRDGTLSLVSAAERTPGDGRGRLSEVGAPIITTDNPLDPFEPPMVPPQKPHYTHPRRHGNPQWVSIFEKTPPPKDGQRSQTGEMTLDLSNHQQGSNEDLAGLGSVWGYIKSALQNTETVPDNDIIRELLAFPRVRDVHWNPTFGDDFVDRNELDVLALVIQATGEEAPNPCTGCRRGLGPFTGCVVVPSTASSATRQKRWQCANCTYVTAKVITCSFKKWSQSRATTAGVANENNPLTPRRTRKPDDNELGSLPASNRTPSKRTSSRLSSSKSSRRPLPTKIPTSRAKSTRTPRFGNNTPSKPPPSATYPLRGGPRRRGSGFTRGAPAEEDGVFMADNGDPNAERAPGPPQAPPSNLAFTGEVAQHAHQMQDWEIAPGHIDIGDGDARRSVVYSAPYLASWQKTRVCENLSLSIRTLGPSEVMHVHLEEEDADKDRLCSILSGHACVKVGDGEETVLGKGGVVMAKPGLAVRIQNKFYEPCSIQIMTIEI